MSAKGSPSKVRKPPGKGKEDDNKKEWTCEMCKNKFTEEKAEVIECEYCSKHFCRKCLNYTSPEYKLLNKRPDLHWYCPPCEEKIQRNQKTEKEIEERCEAFLAKMEERVHKLEQDMETKTDIDQVKALIEEDKKQGGVMSEPVHMKEVEEQIADLRESEERKCNIIVHRCDEPLSEKGEERKEEDAAYVQELCSVLNTPSSKVTSITRLGKREVDKIRNKPRLMRVTFENEKTKANFMSHLKNLAEADEKFKKVGIAHDMTIKERKVNKEKFEEMKLLNQENESGEFKYIVRGPPWERKVVKVK